MKNSDGASPPLPLPPPQQAVEPVDGHALLDSIEAFVRKYCVLPDEESYVAVSLWILHTHCFSAWSTTPRLAILSAEMNSGKTRVLEVVNLLSCASRLLTNVSTSYIFRTYEQMIPTLLVDETDALFRKGPGGKLDPSKEDLRGIINAGYRRGAVVGRVEAVGNKLVPTDFPVFGPVALAGIKALPETLMSRSIVIWMKRRTEGEQVAAFRERKAGVEAQPIHVLARTWGSQNTDALRNLLDNDEVKLPDEITDRNADVWEPLLTLAQHVGGTWHQRGLDASLAFVESHDEANADTMGVELLRDIKDVMGDRVGITTNMLLGLLMADENTMWDHRLTDRKLGKYLKPFGITSSQSRAHIDEHNARGYLRADFEDAWKRYT